MDQTDHAPLLLGCHVLSVRGGVGLRGRGVPSTEGVVKSGSGTKSVVLHIEKSECFKKCVEGLWVRHRLATPRSAARRGGGAPATAVEELIIALPVFGAFPLALFLHTSLQLRPLCKQCSVTCPFHVVFSLLHVFRFS